MFADGQERPRERVKARSVDQHRRFFAVIAEVFSHWPDSHPFQPNSAEHLRAWLLVRAGHCTIRTFHMDVEADIFAKLIPIITATMLGKHSWAKASGNELHVCVPMSIAFKECSHEEFQKIDDDVMAIIRQEANLDPDKMMREAA